MHALLDSTHSIVFQVAHNNFRFDARLLKLNFNHYNVNLPFDENDISFGDSMDVMRSIMKTGIIKSEQNYI